MKIEPSTIGIALIQKEIMQRQLPHCNKVELSDSNHKKRETVKDIDSSFDFKTHKVKILAVFLNTSFLIHNYNFY